VLVDEAGAVVDLVVHDDVEVFLARVLRHIGEGELLVAHICGSALHWVSAKAEVRVSTDVKTGIQ